MLRRRLGTNTAVGATMLKRVALLFFILISLNLLPFFFWSQMKDKWRSSLTSKQYRVLPTLKQCEPQSSQPYVLSSAALSQSLHGVSNLTGPAAADLAGKRYFLAGTRYNREASLPYYTTELLRTALSLLSMGAEVYVSIYESASTDNTRELLVDLRELLLRHNIPFNIVMNGIRRKPEEHRIGFLAHVRNLSIQPMLTSSQTYDAVLFLNDVIFCAKSAIQQLLMFAHGADMVCGADFYIEHGSLKFYDIWVSRDIGGAKFQNALPYIRHDGSHQRFEAFQPFHVYSCWGGMTVVRADAFLDVGLRFRRNFDTECASSECELLCRDLWATGLTKIVLLPTAVTAYSVDTFKHVAERIDRFVFSDLETVAYARAPVTVECCPLEDSCERIVDFSNCIPDGVQWFYKVFGVPRAPSAKSLEVRLLTLQPESVSIHEIVAGLRNGSDCSVYSTARAIPRRIVQTWKTNKPAHIRQHVWFLMLTWISLHGCYDYQLVSDTEIADVIKYSRWFPLWDSLHGGVKFDFGRYLYMYEVGGIYADIDTAAVQNADLFIRYNDAFVVGLEAAFKDKQTSLEWGYAVQKSASLHCWATAPRNPVLLTVIENVAKLLQNPRIPYKKILGRSSGSPAFLYTLLTTGPGPFSDTLAELSSNSSLIRFLGLHAFSGGHSRGDSFYSLQEDAAVRQRDTYVVHKNFGSWVPKRNTENMRQSFSELSVGVPMVAGEWFYASDSHFSRNYFPFTLRNTGYFLVKRTSTQACLLVFQGLGPDDPDSKELWRICRAAAANHIVFAILEADCNLVLYSVMNTVCSCTASMPVRLWESGMQCNLKMWSRSRIPALRLGSNGLGLVFKAFDGEVDNDLSCYVAVTSEKCRTALTEWERTLQRMMHC